MRKKTTYKLLIGEYPYQEFGRFTSKRSLIAACKRHASELGIIEMESFKENADLFLHDDWKGDDSIHFDDMRFFLENGWIEVE